MIRYRLSCDHGHEFEAWFRSSEAFDEQAAAGLVGCAECGSTSTRKAIMAPGLVKEAAGGKADKPAAKMPVGAHLPAEIIDLMRRIRKHVEANADYVGDRFAEEARKIHHQETEARGIYGEATRSEVEALHEEGIEVQPMPVLPEDKN